MFRNGKYFFQEAKSLWRYHRLTNVLSLISIAIIFLLIGVMLTGFLVSNNIVGTMMEEGNINVFLLEDASQERLDEVGRHIATFDGVIEARVVGQEEARERMAQVLDEDQEVLSLFEENPFEAFIDVTLSIDQYEDLLQSIEDLPDVARVVNHQAVIEQINKISGVVLGLGITFLIGIFIASAILIGHMIRQGIYLHKEQIETLTLLGAPKGFIHTPFYMIGIWMTLLGSLVALIVYSLIMVIAYPFIATSLIFIPLPTMGSLLIAVWICLPSVALVMGWIGALTGLKSSKEVREVSLGAQPKQDS